MKKLISLTLVSALTLSLSACGASGSNGTAASASAETPAATEAPAATEVPETAETASASAEETPAAEESAAVTETANAGREVPEGAEELDAVGAADADSTKGTHEITCDSFPVYMDAEDAGMKLDLYFVDGAKDLPYVDTDFCLELFNDFLGNESTGDTFSMEAEGPVVTFTRTNTMVSASGPMTMDFDNDIIEFSDYNLFIQRPGSSTILDTVNLNVFDEKGEPALLLKVDDGALTRLGNELVFPLSDYGIDLIAQDGKYLIPLQTISDLFLAPRNIGDFYFNGQTVIKSSNVTDCSDLYYSAPTGERSEALTNYGYGELCMMLDYFYGFRDTHKIDSFDELFKNVGLKEALLGNDVVEADGSIYRLISDFLQDGHSGWHAFSYLSGPVDYKATDRAKTRVFDSLDRQKNARKEFYPDEVPGYEEVGNTAYITFDSFSHDYMNGEDYYNVENTQDFPDSDTIGLIIKAHEMITRENSPIENVVLDLSTNTGGMDNAAVFVISWFLGDASLSQTDNMTGAMCTSTYRADVNRDRVFDEKDTVANKNLFCMISPCSFSCGNLVPCVFKDSGKVTILGRTSAGGSCSVMSVSSAWGTSFQISSNQRMSFLKNGSFYDIDRGADPDFVLTSPESYYDRASLTEYINSLH